MRDDGHGRLVPKYLNFNATVSYVDGDRMVVMLDNGDQAVTLQNAERLGVQLFFDETTYRLMFDALDRTMRAKNNRLALPAPARPPRWWRPSARHCAGRTRCWCAHRATWQ